ncbi:MAG: Rrf2 family transcriptional regulator [bacterium]|nr:Rrf2 family transcriptional regulator [bacterium]
MFLSKKSIIALNVLLLLLREKRKLSIVEISKKINFPKPFVAVVVNHLIRAGILKGIRGPGGGVEIANENSKISDVLNLFGDRLTDCILGKSKCSEVNACRLHKKWKPIKKEIEKMFSCKIKYI